MIKKPTVLDEVHELQLKHEHNLLHIKKQIDIHSRIVEELKEEEKNELNHIKQLEALKK